jgi:hypothetical protein
VAERIVAKYPRKNFKQEFLKAYFAGFAHKPETTYGTVNAGIGERFIPGFKNLNVCELMAGSRFPDSEVAASACNRLKATIWPAFSPTP